VIFVMCCIMEANCGFAGLEQRSLVGFVRLVE
jgi:hypothetical protein